MCGRYTVVATAEEIEKRFNIEVPEFYTQRYNAAPTQVLPVVANQSPESLSFYRWGLVPPWAKDLSIGSKMINARSETIAHKPAFKNAFAKKRCLVIADGFYEWKRQGNTKVPYRITMADGRLFAFAGIWEQHTDAEGNETQSFSIITTEANEKVAELHDRMPVILDKTSENLWLHDAADPKEHLDLLRPCDPELIKTYPVSRRVNSPANEDPELVKPAPGTPGQQSLFEKAFCHIDCVFLPEWYLLVS